LTALPAPFKVDPLIAEARRRQRRRRLVLIAAVVASAATGVGLWRATSNGSSPAARVPRLSIAQAAHTAFVSDEGMTGGVGWAMNGLGLWLTTDGGRTWLTATPPHVRATGDAVARIGQIQFVDPKHGWLTAGDVFGGFKIPKHAASLRHMEIDRTTDGGRTWKASVPPGCLETCGGDYISFLDTRHGFAIATKGLFKTNDGGASWTRVSRPPFAGAITFLDERHGFGVSDSFRWAPPKYDIPIGGGVLYRTVDGGVTWSRVVLRAPRAYARWERTSDPVTFFDNRNGVVPVRFRDPRTHAQRLVVYATSDGGATWTARPAPATVTWSATWGLPTTWYFSAPNARDWVVTGKRVLYVTADGGLTWRTIHPRDVPRGGSIWNAVFSSADDGWAIFAQPGMTAYPALVQTTDGGRDWSALAPPVPKPKPIPTRTVCASWCQRP